MTSPGTISLREETFRAMLTDIVHSLKMHGFKNIILIGDSGGNQAGQRTVADSLTAIWKGEPVVAHIQEYYDYAGAAKHMETRGIVGGRAATTCTTIRSSRSTCSSTDPTSVRYDERVKAGKATINGVSIADREKATAAGEGDRRVPRRRHGGGDQQGDREQGDAAGTTPLTPGSRRRSQVAISPRAAVRSC